MIRAQVLAVATQGLTMRVMVGLIIETDNQRAGPGPQEVLILPANSTIEQIQAAVSQLAEVFGAQVARDGELAKQLGL